MSETKATVRRFVDEVLNQQRQASFEDLIDDAVVNHHAPPGVPTTKDGWRQNYAMFCAGFPDMRWTIHDLVAEDELVVARTTMEATHAGDFFGIPATHRRVTVPSIHILRIRHGRIVEHWGNEDALGMLAQLGVMPVPAAA
jgi:steroid delta-isomerase-like uncharacterized protein